MNVFRVSFLKIIYSLNFPCDTPWLALIPNNQIRKTHICITIKDEVYPWNPLRIFLKKKIERCLSRIIYCLSLTLTTIDMFTVYASALKKTSSSCVFCFCVRLCMYVVINIQTSLCVHAWSKTCTRLCPLHFV